jgi:hypothetical protein
MKNNNLTSLDTDQIIKKKFDESLDADRVIIVGQDFSIDSDKIADAVRQGLASIDFNKMSENTAKLDLQPQIQIVKENVFIPKLEIKEIEKQVIVKEIEYRTIEIPVITEKIVYVDRPVIIKEIEYKEIIKERYYPFVMKASAVIQAICIIGILLINLLKK